MIDADLQYPPEYILNLFDELNKGYDVVVANRHFEKVSLIRKIISTTFSFLFGKVLHGLNVDVQSGLKLFKKEIFGFITLDPTPWTFDLEFLLKARSLGYKISSRDILFLERNFGESKVDLLPATKEIATSAIRLKLEDFNFRNLRNSQHFGFLYKGYEYITHTDLSLEESAFFQLTRKQTLIFSLVIFFSLLFLLVDWYNSLVLLVSILTTIYFTDILFNCFLIIKSFVKKPEIQISDKELQKVNGWPTYTILCPLYKEWQVIPQFIKAISNFDYPKDKLQVLLLLEEDDKETLLKVKEFNLPNFFEVVVVPHSLPKTKPKACNFGLQKALGEYLVIFDAEDIPEKDQLKKAVIAFEKVNTNVVCIQAKLNFYNPHQNTLTKLFTSEYSLWFDLVLPGLQSINAPIPLGGTSNHFKTSTLKNLKGFDSTTYEEANSEIKNWFWQRTRWIKGYIQTFLVHNRSFDEFVKNNRKKDIPIFQIVVGGKVLSMFINPIMWMITFLYFAFRPTLGPTIESFFPTPVLYMGVVSIVFGNFLYFYYYMIGCAKRRHFDLIKYGFLIPVYWIAMSIAAWVSLYKLIVQPHYWFKTKHGLHLDKQQKFATGVETEIKPAYST
ncbi:MAG: Glycosyltransferase, group 2 family protein [Candidatus Daviesbacteria bacterium GW2011_GWA1_38_7]|nr:MAG: Glycosyltransferase, group 2 family protein [Candidatus Daviesbacteria bacterium GW2011_GWA1_38_7]